MPTEYQDESPMPSMRGDKRSFDRIIRNGRKRPRKHKVMIGPEAMKWAEHIATVNRKRKRPPYDSDSVVDKIVLRHKVTELAKRAK